MTYRVLSLFAGIGGFDLGLERTGGFKTVAFCEIDPFCRRVLAKHWPEVPCFEDVRELTGEQVGPVDVICGGFPCQDISLAGSGAGLAGERSGLWSEYARLIGELRPLYVIVENVAALLGRGLSVVLGDLASLGYDAEWHCIPASAVGAPHRRDRIWILAYPNGEWVRGCGCSAPAGASGSVQGEEQERQWVRANSGPGGQGGDVAHAQGERRGKARGLRHNEPPQRIAGSGAHVAHAGRRDAQRLVPQRHDPIIRKEQIERQARLCRGAGDHQDWTAEPAVGRVAHGVPHRVGQLRAYGNAVVPQIPELIGRAILAAGETRNDSDERLLEHVMSMQDRKVRG